MVTLIDLLTLVAQPIPSSSPPSRLQQLDRTNLRLCMQRRPSARTTRSRKCSKTSQISPTCQTCRIWVIRHQQATILISSNRRVPSMLIIQQARVYDRHRSLTYRRSMEARARLVCLRDPVCTSLTVLYKKQTAWFQVTALDNRALLSSRCKICSVKVCVPSQSPHKPSNSKVLTPRQVSWRTYAREPHSVSSCAPQCYPSSPSVPMSVQEHKHRWLQTLSKPQ